MENISLLPSPFSGRRQRSRGEVCVVEWEIEAGSVKAERLNRSLSCSALENSDWGCSILAFEHQSDTAGACQIQMAKQLCVFRNTNLILSQCWRYKVGKQSLGVLEALKYY